MSDHDKAAVEALLKIRCQPTSKAYSHGDLAIPYREGARAILDAIRAGKVPGVRIAGDEECLPLERERNAKLRAEVERLTAERDAAQRQVIGVMICTAINGADWIGEKLDSGERPSWQDALDMVEKLKAKLMAERDAEKARADEMKADGERAVMEERNRTDKATAERDRLAGLLRRSRICVAQFCNESGLSLTDEIDAALAEIGGGK